MLTRRQFIKRCATTVLAASSVSFFLGPRISRAATETLPILLYHRVGPEPDALTISIDRFKEDLQYLSAAGYQTITLEQGRDYLSGRKLLEGKPILLTFDDGYLNNYTNAFPILQSFSMVASFFIITGMIEQQNRITVPQLREMASAGMSFGSHTVSPRPLAELAADQPSRELVQSKGDLEDILGRGVDFVAYPCGSYNQDTLQAAHDAGYQAGLTTHMGFADSQENFLTLNRIPIFHFDRSLSYVMLRKGWTPSLLSSI
jgi:peptidoglycan/xylan/chitin deacetylase (PgdA/CDA1 family)